MTIEEKKMIVRSVKLSNYEMNTLIDAGATLKRIFGRLTSKDNLSRCYNILSELECLIEEAGDNNNCIIEFKEDN